MDKNYPGFETVGIGDAMVDLFTHASRLPPKGGNIWSTAVTIIPGGTTANVTANIAKLGIPSAFVGCLGDDPYGHYILSEFDKVGVDTQWTVIKPGTYTGIVLAIIDDEGERTFIACAKGASHTFLSKEEIRLIDYNRPLLIHSSGVCLVEEPSRSVLLDALEEAHRSGIIVYFDPNLRLEGNIFQDELRLAQWKAISSSHVVMIGAEELELLCAGRSCREGARLIMTAGPEIVVVKRGENGAILFSREGEDSVPAFKVPVSSTAGAGDAFDAGFIAARVRGADLHDALVYASTIAAIKVTRQGARAVPNHSEAMAFLSERGYRIRLTDE
ncbi:MAG: carbohydrate kinase family protein [Bellilinea sp.]